MWHHHDVGFKLNCWKFAENIGIEVSYTSGRDLKRPLKIQKNGRKKNTCILTNQLYKFSHWIPSYRMSSNKKECIPIHYFELNLTALPTDKFQLTEKHDQAQNNILNVHSLTSYSSYTKEFDVKTYIVDLVKYMLCSIHSLTFPRILQISTLSITHFNADIVSKLTRIKT